MCKSNPSYPSPVWPITLMGWPGLGQLMYEGIYTRDYPLLMGMFVVISIGVITANLVTDIVYGFLDPRIRQQ